MSASKICPQCNNEYPLDQRFCPLDGATLKSQGAVNDLVGSVVADRYYVLRKLGEGGMGQVYLAEHVRMGRKAALKVMLPSMVQDADAISRFNREAANASRISHPNVAAIYDFGETGDGLIYLAMEFVEGDALTQVVERAGALPPLRAADIIRQAGDALASAHDMGIVHRDLKPDNIMIARNRDGSDCVKVVDFGIAKSNEGSQKVTKTGLVVGTPEYMSPEQLAGDKLDGRSDTYSLALVAFNVLTGHLPFPSESAQESMIMRLTDRPRRLVDMRSEVAWPAELQAVMDRALERDAKLRYASAAEFGRDFARAIEAMPEAATMTAGTQIVDSSSIVPATRVAAVDAGGATAVLDSASAAGRAPKTVAADTRAGAAALIGARGITGRTPMLAAAAVVAVIAVGALSVKLIAGADAQPAASDSSAVTAPALEQTEVVTAADSTATPPADQFAKQADDDAPPAGVRPVGTDVPSRPASPSAAEIEAELSRAESLADFTTASPESARDALAIVRKVDGSLSDRRDIVRAAVIRGNAHIVLDDMPAACRAFRSVRDVAPGTQWATAVAKALESAECSS